MHKLSLLGLIIAALMLVAPGSTWARGCGYGYAPRYYGYSAPRYHGYNYSYYAPRWRFIEYGYRGR
jgi:hypothetical protein